MSRVLTILKPKETYEHFHTPTTSVLCWLAIDLSHPLLLQIKLPHTKYNANANNNANNNVNNNANNNADTDADATLDEATDANNHGKCSCKMLI